MHIGTGRTDGVRRVLVIALGAWLASCGGSRGEPVPPAEPGAPSSPTTPPPTACTTSDDCRACGAAACTCTAVAAATCPPMPHPCAADPCASLDATCHEGRCVVAAADGPCERDDECEIRDQDCGCDCMPALRNAPRTRVCAGVGCGGRPQCATRAARCDPATHTCVAAGP